MSCDDKRSDERPRRTLADEGINGFLNPLVMFISETSSTCWSYLKGSVVIFAVLLASRAPFAQHFRPCLRSFSLPPCLTRLFCVPKSSFRLKLPLLTLKQPRLELSISLASSLRPDWAQTHFCVSACHFSPLSLVLAGHFSPLSRPESPTYTQLFFATPRNFFTYISLLSLQSARRSAVASFRHISPLSQSSSLFILTLTLANTSISLFHDAYFPFKLPSHFTFK